MRIVGSVKEDIKTSNLQWLNEIIDWLAKQELALMVRHWGLEAIEPVNSCEITTI